MAENKLSQPVEPAFLLGMNIKSSQALCLAVTAAQNQLPEDAWGGGGEGGYLTQVDKSDAIRNHAAVHGDQWRDS